MQGIFSIDIFKNDRSIFEYDDIKDYFIPFLNLLSETYELGGLTPIVFDKKRSQFRKGINDVINDDVENAELISIFILIEDKI